MSWALGLASVLWGPSLGTGPMFQGVRDCPAYLRDKLEGPSVFIAINLPNTACVLCRQKSCSESFYDIMVLQDGKLKYFNSTYRGYVSISQKGFAANRSKWLEDEYLILTSLERECVAHVTLMTADSTLSPLSLHVTTQAIERSWNETGRKNFVTSHGHAGLIITVVVMVVMLLLLFVLYKRKVIPCGRKKPEIQASEDELL